MSAAEFDSYFNIAIASIIARELLEGSFIIVNYRTVIKNAVCWSNEEKKMRALREVTVSAIIASLVAIVMVSIIAVVLVILSSHLNERTISIISGVAELVAAVAIMQLSIKIPVWLGIYENISILPCRQRPNSFANNHSLDEGAQAEVATISLGEIRFNVAWNIWREVAECGVFLIPFLLEGTAKPIPLSALVGAMIAAIVAMPLYVALNRTASKFWLALIMSLLTGMLSVGLFAGAAHEFEIVAGNESATLFALQSPFFSSEKFPMLIFEPFGFTSSPTVVQIICYFSWLMLGCTLHYLKYRASKRYRKGINVRIDVQPARKLNTFENSDITDITLDPENSMSDSADLEASFPE